MDKMDDQELSTFFLKTKQDILNKPLKTSGNEGKQSLRDRKQQGDPLYHPHQLPRRD